MAFRGCVWAADQGKNFLISLLDIPTEATHMLALAGSCFPDRIRRYKIV